MRELPSMVKGAGLRIQSRRSSGVQIPLPALIICLHRIANRNAINYFYYSHYKKI